MMKFLTIGIDPQEVYLASDVDLRISELEVERQLLNDCIGDKDKRIERLESVMRSIVGTATATSHSANYCIVHRQLIGKAREALGL